MVYLPQAVFRVRPVTRCTSSLPGHSEPVISVQFSSDGLHLASGSGDKTVRLWDLATELPKHVCKGHNHWVLCIAWSPNGKKLASACKNGEVGLACWKFIINNFRFVFGILSLENKWEGNLRGTSNGSTASLGVHYMKIRNASSWPVQGKIRP